MAVLNHNQFDESAPRNRLTLHLSRKHLCAVPTPQLLRHLLELERPTKTEQVHLQHHQPQPPPHTTPSTHPERKRRSSVFSEDEVFLGGAIEPALGLEVVEGGSIPFAGFIGFQIPLSVEELGDGGGVKAEGDPEGRAFRETVRDTPQPLIS